jgi:ABC-type transport system substrate-binding protein
MPGFADRKIYPLTPDVPMARKLMGGRRGNATFYACDVAPCPQVAQIVANNLEAIGIDVEVKSFALGEYIERLYTPGEPFDIAVTVSGADSPDPGRFLGIVFAQKSAYGGASSIVRPPYGQRLAAAGRLYGPKRYLAFGELDVELARNAAPGVPFGADTRHDFFSRRMGCQVYQPVYGISLAALCIRD